MRTCVSMWSLVRPIRAGELDTVGFVDYAAAVGARGVELLSIFWKDRDAELPLVRAALARHGLAVAAYDTSNDFSVPDPAARAVQVNKVKGDIDVALALGANTLRVFAGDVRPDTTFDTCLDWIVGGLAEVAAYAAERGVILALENHGKLAGRSEQVLEILRRVGSPALKVNIDTANFLLVDEDPNAAIRRVAAKTGHVHFKDFAPAPPDWTGFTYSALSGTRFVGVVAGTGKVDLTRAVADLRAAGYTGWLSIEYEGEGDVRAGTADSLKALQGALKQVLP